MSTRFVYLAVAGPAQPHYVSLAVPAAVLYLNHVVAVVPFGLSAKEARALNLEPAKSLVEVFAHLVTALRYGF